MAGDFIARGYVLLRLGRFPAETALFVSAGSLVSVARVLTEPVMLAFGPMQRQLTKMLHATFLIDPAIKLLNVSQCVAVLHDVRRTNNSDIVVSRLDIGDCHKVSMHKIMGNL